MVNLYTIMLLFLISSCTCFTIKNDTRRVWSFKQNQCRCQTYSFSEIKSLDKLVPCEDYFLPLVNDEKNIRSCEKEKFRRDHPELCSTLPNEQYCEDLVGFSVTSWAKNITPHAKESKRCFEDKCGKK